MTNGSPGMVPCFDKDVLPSSVEELRKRAKPKKIFIGVSRMEGIVIVFQNRYYQPVGSEREGRNERNRQPSR